MRTTPGVRGSDACEVFVDKRQTGELFFTELRSARRSSRERLSLFLHFDSLDEPRQFHRNILDNGRSVPDLKCRSVWLETFRSRRQLWTFR
jgi:hypothetical protein